MIDIYLKYLDGEAALTELAGFGLAPTTDDSGDLVRIETRWRTLGLLMTPDIIDVNGYHIHRGRLPLELLESVLALNPQTLIVDWRSDSGEPEPTYQCDSVDAEGNPIVITTQPGVFC